MTKGTRNVFIGLIVFIIFVIAARIVMSRNEHGVNEIKEASKVLLIDETQIYSYELGAKSGIYVTAEELMQFNIGVEFDGNTIRISYPSSVQSDKKTYIPKNYSNFRTEKEKYNIYFNGQNNNYSGYRIKGADATLIPMDFLGNTFMELKSDTNSANTLKLVFREKLANATPVPEPSSVSVTPPTVDPNGKSTIGGLSNGKIVVLDPGHGKSSGAMSSDEKKAYGWEKNANGQWGEWRHFVSGTWGQDCRGTDSDCWYPMGNGDRDTEPDINLNNALAAKKYLEQMGYTVRMTRTSNDENPTFTQRASWAFPNRDASQKPDALCIVCIHSNAGGGRGSAYISLSGNYTQSYIPADYVSKSNALGETINNRITSQTGLSAWSGGRYDGLPTAILFHKSPVYAAYLEIGFFDNQSDLSILQSESDAIGKAIADGINDFFGN